MSVKRQRILLVEDDAKTVATIKLDLEHGGFDVSVATNGRQALEKLGVNCYSLMIVDIRFQMDAAEPEKLSFLQVERN